MMEKMHAMTMKMPLRRKCGKGQAQKPTELGKYERLAADFVMLSG